MQYTFLVEQTSKQKSKTEPNYRRHNEGMQTKLLLSSTIASLGKKLPLAWLKTQWCDILFHYTRKKPAPMRRRRMWQFCQRLTFPVKMKDPCSSQPSSYQLYNSVSECKNSMTSVPHVSLHTSNPNAPKVRSTEDRFQVNHSSNVWKTDRVQKLKGDLSKKKKCGNQR